MYHKGSEDLPAYLSARPFGAAYIWCLTVDGNYGTWDCAQVRDGAASLAAIRRRRSPIAHAVRSEPLRPCRAVPER